MKYQARIVAQEGIEWKKKAHIARLKAIWAFIFNIDKFS